MPADFETPGDETPRPRHERAPSDGGSTPAGAEPVGGIPDAPAADPTFDATAADDGSTRPLGELPALDFWDVLYSRRSIRKFDDRPVPRALVDQVMHAGIWAPSSCNYQMWDLVAVTDPEVNGRLAALSTQMANAPVNIVVSYGRDFSEEAWANIQSASALVQNMSLAAHALGLGTFWITQTGGAERVREEVGLPVDRLVIAVLALGYPKVLPKRGPKRRPLDQVTHYEHYAGRPIPSSTDPEDWEPDLLATYQRARVLNGLRHNKPRAWEVRALDEAIDALVPDGIERPEAGPGGEDGRGRWLDVLPCTGIITARLGTRRKGFRFDVVERTAEVAAFCANRVSPRGATYGWPAAADVEGGGASLDAAPEGAFDVVSCFFRLEGLRDADRAALLESMARWVKPGGRVLIAYVSSRSYHGLTERMRARRGGPGGVEYVLSPDPGIGPFTPLAPDHVGSLVGRAGLEIEQRFGTQPAPPPEEIEFRTRNMRPAAASALRRAAAAARVVMRTPGADLRRGRFQFVVARRARS